MATSASKTTTLPLLKDKLIVRYWSALVSDFETCIKAYLNQPLSGFAPFAEIFKRMKMPLIFNIVVAYSNESRGVGDTYEILTSLILETARGFWLRPRGQDLEEGSQLLDYRSRLAGFYLTYAMFFKQPEEGRVKISLSHKLYDHFEEFLADTQPNDVSKNGLLEEDKFFLRSMIELLKINDAFEANLTGFYSYGIEPWRRYLYLMQGNPALAAAEEEGALADQVTQDVVNKEEEEGLILTEFVKAIESLIESTSMVLEKDAKEDFKENQEELVDVMKDAVTKLDGLTAQPALPMSLLTGEEVVERRMLSDYRTQTAKFRKQLEGPAQVKRRYMKEGTAWSKTIRKTVEEEEEASSSKAGRPRGGFPRNVWVYLKGLPFDHGGEDEEEEVQEEGADVVVPPKEKSD